MAPANPQLLSHHGTHSPSSEELRFAVVVSSKVSKRSVVRNRLRRSLHDAGAGGGSCYAPVPQRTQSHWLLLSLKPGAADLSDDELPENGTHYFTSQASSMTGTPPRSMKRCSTRGSSPR